MDGIFSASPRSIELLGKFIPEAADRQVAIAGFDQERYSAGHVLLLGTGGIGSQIAPSLVRKGIGYLTLLDHDTVAPSNLNRQRFYAADIGEYKAIALARNLVPECTAATNIHGNAVSLQTAIDERLSLDCDVVVCGVDNNPTRALALRHFYRAGIPVIFAAVSTNADHGYVFVQQPGGPCLACLFPDLLNDDRFPCPGTPAIADILQAVGALATYAIDTIITARPRSWNYRRISLSGEAVDATAFVPLRHGCSICAA